VSFKDLGLVPPLLRALEATGYETPTPIQTAAIPPALAGRDILGCAQTGTGKTAAFVLPILQRLDANAGNDAVLRALVVTPTRELAAQIGESFSTYGEQLDLWHSVIFGGVPDKPQIKDLRKGVDALVATPGRLLDLMNRGEVDLSRLEVFVLDEADQMLDMGFLPDVRRIVAKLPKQRQTLFFSATMPDEIRKLAEGLLRDPVAVAVARVAEPIERIDQRLYFVDKNDKRRLLVDLLRRDGVRRSLVFSRTKHGANRIAEWLDQAGIGSAAIHGNKSQAARTRALEAFRRGELRVLVATDLAARGIDIDDITHVINFDLPNVPETYVHRIGRTARAGASGVAWSFCDVEERGFLVDIERLIRRHIDRIDDHAYLPSQPAPRETDLAGKGGGGGPARPAQSRGGGGGHTGNRRPAQARSGGGNAGRPSAAGRGQSRSR
jgi:ATP-dependent RNA helicase RhlE